MQKSMADFKYIQNNYIDLGQENRAVYAWAVGPPKFMGSATSSRSWIFPFVPSKRRMFSVSAFINRLACWGVNIIRDFTLLFGVPGITFTKSMTNSAWECVIIARLAYSPSATSSLISIFNWLFGCSGIVNGFSKNKTAPSYNIFHCCHAMSNCSFNSDFRFPGI
jgi:hypothetical protein